MKFEITNKNGNRVRTVFCKNKRFVYLSEDVHRELTFAEIYDIGKFCLNKYVNEYKDYKIQRKPITNSIFRLSVYYPHGKKSNIDFSDERILYEIEIDNKNENKIIFEYKNSNLIENKDPINYFYCKIEVIVFNEDEFFQYDGEKDPRIEDVCIICKRNKPNILITKCFHLVVCTECFKLENINCCPYCHRPIAAIHRVVFARSTRK